MTLNFDEMCYDEEKTNCLTQGEGPQVIDKTQIAMVNSPILDGNNIVYMRFKFDNVECDVQKYDRIKEE